MSIFTDALNLGQQAHGGNISYFFSADFDGWNAHEKGQFELALQQWQNVANITFTAAPTEASANFVLNNVSPATMAQLSGDNTTLGVFQLPNAANSTQQGSFNNGAPGWDWQNTYGGLSQGGYGFITILHEVGHGLGLDHPHSGTILPGVTGPFNTGNFDYNQGVNTVMSYNDGLVSNNLNPSSTPGYGWTGTPMAFDIAAIQELYGANNSFASGDNDYYLDGSNAIGTFYSSIWDTGGTDTIHATGNLGSVINLKAASLINGDADAGGAISSTNGIYGGFTVAHGVDIENANGAGGNDIITGNNLANILDGKAGNDQLFGDAGDDLLIGGAGADILNGGAGTDAASYENAGGTIVLYVDAPSLGYGDAAGDQLTSIEVVLGSLYNDFIYGSNVNDDIIFGNNGIDTLYGFGGNDELYGGDDFDILYGGEGNDYIEGNDGLDILVGGNGTDTIYGGADFDQIYGDGGNDFLYGGDAADYLFGGDNNDTLNGDNGNDFLYGQAGDDTLNGGAGIDVLQGNGGNDTLFGGDDGTQVPNGLFGDAGNDFLIGGTGIDYMTGGTGNDTFTFTANGYVDVVTDFELGDVIKIIGTDITSFNDLILDDRLSQVGNYTAINTGDLLGSTDIVYLQDVDFNDLTAADFAFV